MVGVAHPLADALQGVVHRDDDFGISEVFDADRVPELPRIVCDRCLWVLAKNPDERPQTSADLRAAFDTILGN